MLSVPAQRQGLCLEPQARVSDLPGVGVEPAHQAEETLGAGKAGGPDRAAGDERGLVDGLHARPPGGWPGHPPVQRPRRLQSRGAGHRSGLLTAGRAGDPDPVAYHRVARQARRPALRQRTGIYQRGVADLGGEAGHPPGIHPAGQTAAERLHRALQPYGAL